MVNVVVSTNGTPGPRGSSWLSGSGAPSSNTGFDGDFYLDTTNVGVYYGPKTSGAWGSSHPFTGPLTNFSAVVAPTVNNDSSQGYSRGSVWLNTANNAVYNCLNPAVGAAVWERMVSVSASGFMANTGVLSGGNFTVNGTNPAAFDLVQTVGYVADYTTNPASPIVTKVTIPAQTVTITGADANREINWWVSDINGNISSVGSSRPTDVQRRSMIQIGATASTIGTGSIFAVAPAPAQLTQPYNQLLDVLYGLGPFVISGNALSPNGTNLSFNKTVGEGIFANFQAATVPNDPHHLTSPAETPVTFRRATQISGSENGALVTTVDPANYDVGGVITPVPGGTNASTIQRIWLFGTGSPAIQIIVQYGQTVYSSLSAAQAAIGTTNYIVNPDFSGIGVVLAWLVVTKSATDLSNPSQATFVVADKFPKP